MTEDTLFSNYITGICDKLVANDRCCCSVRVLPAHYQGLVKTIAASKDLLSRPYYHNGEHFVSIFTTTCFHYLPVQPTLRMSDQSRVELGRYFNRNPLTVHNRSIMSPNYFRPSCTPRAEGTLSCYEGYLTKTTVPRVRLPAISNQRSFPVLESSDTVLQMFTNNRVVVLQAAVGAPITVEVCLKLFEASSSRNKPCRVLSVDANELVCLANFWKARSLLDERLREHVHYQVLLSAKDCSSASVVFTTSQQFLRSLVANRKKTLDNVSHLVVNNCDEHFQATDVLLLELKEMLYLCPVLKVIVVTSEGSAVELFAKYFDTEEVHTLPPKTDVLVPKFLDQILSETNFEICTSVVSNDTVDGLILTYLETGDAEAFNAFLCLVDEEGVSINSRHSVLKVNMVMAVIKTGKVEHLLILLDKGAKLQGDPDYMYQTVYDYARKYACHAFARSGIVQLLRLKRARETPYPPLYDSFLLHRYEVSRSDRNELEIDHALVTHLLKNICMERKCGNVLVFLPNFESLVRQEFFIVRDAFFTQFKILLVHEDMELADYKNYLQSKSAATILLATSIAETLLPLPGVDVVVDSGRVQGETYNAASQGSKPNLQWISKENALKRLQIGRNACYRLYSSHDWADMQPQSPAEMEVQCLDRVLLNLKIISDCNMICDYVRKLVRPPPMLHVRQSARKLAEMGVLDENEAVTWLGVRLFDIPIDLQLGKALIYSIVFNCVDPVLKIVAVLQSSDRLPIASDLLGTTQLFEVTPSTEEGASQILQKLNHSKKYIMRVLLASKLLNSEPPPMAINWSLVRSCFVAGFYPKIFANHQLMCSKTRLPLLLYSNSVLSQRIPTRNQLEWYIYSRASAHYTFATVENCVQVTPIMLALFAGPLKLDSQDVVPNGDGGLSATEHESSSLLVIDEWLSFSGTTKICENVFALRVKLAQYMSKYLSAGHPVGNVDSTIVDVLAQLLLTEDGVPQ